MRDGGFVQGLEYFRRNNWRLGEPDLAPLGRESLRDVDGRGTASSGPVRAYDDMPIDSDMDFDADDMRSTRSGAGGPLPSAALSVLDARVAAAAGISGPALTAVRELDAQRMESAKNQSNANDTGHEGIADVGRFALYGRCVVSRGCRAGYRDRVAGVGEEPRTCVTGRAGERYASGERRGVQYRGMLSARDCPLPAARY